MSNCSSTSVSRLDHVVGGLGPGLVRAAGLEHLVGRQRVGDVAGQRELLDPGRQRGVRRAARARPSRRPSTRPPGSPSSWAAFFALADARGPRAPGCRRAGRPCPRRSSAIGPTRRRGRPRLSGAVSSASGAAASSVRTPQQPVAERRQALGDLVDRRGGDHQHPEERKQHEQRYDDQGAAQQVHQQRGDDEPDRAAGLLEGLGVAGCGSGCRWRCAPGRARRTAARPSR